MSAVPQVSPFRFGFYAGFGFFCAQIVFATITFLAVALLGLGTLLAAAARLTGNAAPVNSSVLAPTDHAVPAAHVRAAEGQARASR